MAAADALQSRKMGCSQTNFPILEKMTWNGCVLQPGCILLLDESWHGGADDGEVEWNAMAMAMAMAMAERRARGLLFRTLYSAARAPSFRSSTP